MLMMFTGSDAVSSSRSRGKFLGLLYVVSWVVPSSVMEVVPELSLNEVQPAGRSSEGIMFTGSNAATTEGRGRGFAAITSGLAKE